jgi:hypothetical protein
MPRTKSNIGIFPLSLNIFLVDDQLRQHIFFKLLRSASDKHSSAMKAHGISRNTPATTLRINQHAS